MSVLRALRALVEGDIYLCWYTYDAYVEYYGIGMSMSMSASAILCNRGVYRKSTVLCMCIMYVQYVVPMQFPCW